jgi:hypothetical protein
MPAVPLAPDAQAFLDSARKASESDLKKGGTPDSMLDLSPGNSYTDISVGSGRGSAIPPPRGPAPPPSANAVEPMDNQEQAPPVVDDDYAADAKSQNTWGKAIGEGITQGVPQATSEIGYGLMRGAVKTIGNVLGLVGVAGHDILSTQDVAHKQDTDDQIFKIVDGIKSAADKYLAADQTNANPFASTVGSVAEGAAPMLAGPAVGLPLMAINSAMDSGTDAVKRGDSLTTAMTLALAHTVGTVLTWDLPALKYGKTQLIPGIKSPNVAKRLAANIGGFLGVDAVTDALTKYILNNEDYKDAVEKYKEMGRNPDLSLPKPSMFGSEYTTGGKDEEAADQTFTPSAAGMNMLMGTMAAILHTPEAAKVAARADKGKKPAVAPGPSDAATPPGPPGPSAAAVAPPVAGAAPEANMPPPPSDAATPPPAAAPTPADNPTAEPVADLQAQIADMNDPKTARKAVYLSPENVKSLGADGIKALVGGAKAIKNFDDKGGVLIVPDPKARLAAVKLKKSGADMQAVLGQLTGAGDGKNPANTTVVQGQTPAGAVATESLVSPAEVPGAVAKAAAEGKTPVVTDVASALDRREAESQPATAPKFAAGDRRIVKIAGEEVPVVVAGESAGGKVPVKLIDEDGRVTRQVQNVPESMFVEPAAKAAPAEASPMGSTQSPEAKQSAPAPAEASGSAPAKSIRDKEGNLLPMVLDGEIKPVESKPLTADEQADVDAALARRGAKSEPAAPAPKKTWAERQAAKRAEAAAAQAARTSEAPIKKLRRL